MKNNRKQEFIEQLAKHLDEHAVKPEDIGAVTKASSYHQLVKDDNGKLQPLELWSFQYKPVNFNVEPKWELITQSPRYNVPKTQVKSVKSQYKTCVIIPDIQIGYFRNHAEELTPIHDENAIKIVLQLIEDTQPTLVVLVGDNLDFPEFGKYRTTPAFQQTTQASIDRAGLLAAQLRAAAPKARIVWLAGNHEERLPNYILDNAKAAFALRKAAAPKSWPVMSVPSLCNFDVHNIEYVPGYPAGEFWINDNLKVIHGTKVKSGANTAHAYLRDEKVSVIYGHIHRVETAYKTRRDSKGPRTTMAASAGCLARIDGSVPSMKGSKDLDGRPIKISEDWQQGVAVINYETSGDNKFSYEVMPILNGWAMFRGIVYTA